MVDTNNTLDGDDTEDLNGDNLEDNLDNDDLNNNNENTNATDN